MRTVLSLRASPQAVNHWSAHLLFNDGRREHGRKCRAWKAIKFVKSDVPKSEGRRLTSYPLTLIFENDNTALPEVGLPIDVAGRKVVKMSMFFTCGSNDLASVGFERMR